MTGVTFLIMTGWIAAVAVAIGRHAYRKAQGAPAPQIDIVDQFGALTVTALMVWVMWQFAMAIIGL